VPFLVIIAGPNGAGKSTVSSRLLEEYKIEAFDFDKEVAKQWSAFSFDPALEDNIDQYVRELYAEKKEVSLTTANHFAFESNFHVSEIDKTVTEFRAKGFTTELNFIFLENVDLAFDRVRQRVAQGGHTVDQETIRERFSEGLKNLDSLYFKFDVVYLFNSKQNQIEGLGVLDNRIKSVAMLRQIPGAISKHLPHLSRYIQEKSRSVDFGR
jgi:predicted ABC-type ATPase